VQDHRLPVRPACQIVKLSRAVFYRTGQSPMERDRQALETRCCGWSVTRAGTSVSAAIGCGCSIIAGTTIECIACTVN